jgi:hypothetical protein
VPKFVVYEVWTRSRVITADDLEDAMLKGEPKPVLGMTLSNWHAVDVDKQEPSEPGLNYRQEK